MSPTQARARSARPSSERKPLAGVRLESAARRDALLDAAVALVSAKGVHVVSMEAVAERAGVSRSLVYKHFANRDELLAAAYRRESANLHQDLVAQVASAGPVEEMFRALLVGSIRASAERGQIFTALRAAGGWNREIGREQRSRDRQTVRAFAAVAARQYGLERRRSSLCHGRPVGRARCRPGAMARRSDGGEPRDPRGDLRGHGGRRVFRGLRARWRPAALGSHRNGSHRTGRTLRRAVGGPGSNSGQDVAKLTDASASDTSHILVARAGSCARAASLAGPTRPAISPGPDGP